MSQTDAKSFVDLLIKDEAFRRQLLSELRGDDDRTPQRLCQLGGDRGLSFTESELVDAWKKSQSTDQRALSDAELAEVTGGAASLSRLSNLMKAACKGEHLPEIVIEL
jgi:hypothetical protein